MRGRSSNRNNDRPVQLRQSTLSHGKDGSRPRSNSRVSTNCDHVRCYRCREYDHFASECPNTPTDEEPDCDNADPASLQMMTQDYYPIDSEGDIEHLPPHFCHQKKRQMEKSITSKTKRPCA